MKSPDLSHSAQRVQDALRTHGIDLQVVELGESTRTAQDAANAIGCEVGQIAKSLIFRGEQSGRPVMLIVSGANRVAVDKAAVSAGEPLSKAGAAFVREATGYAIGGVPPVGHATDIGTYVDRDLLGYDVIWAAAGTPRAVFALTPDQLVELTHAAIVAVT